MFSRGGSHADCLPASLSSRKLRMNQKLWFRRFRAFHRNIYWACVDAERNVPPTLTLPRKVGRGSFPRGRPHKYSPPPSRGRVRTFHLNIYEFCVDVAEYASSPSVIPSPLVGEGRVGGMSRLRLGRVRVGGTSLGCRVALGGARPARCDQPSRPGRIEISPSSSKSSSPIRIRRVQPTSGSTLVW